MELYCFRSFSVAPLSFACNVYVVRPDDRGSRMNFETDTYHAHRGVICTILFDDLYGHCIRLAYSMRFVSTNVNRREFVIYFCQFRPFFQDNSTSRIDIFLFSLY